MIPTLKALDLMSDRAAARYDEMFRANFGADFGSVQDDLHGLPEDLEAWVEEGA